MNNDISLEEIWMAFHKILTVCLPAFLLPLARDGWLKNGNEALLGEFLSVTIFFWLYAPNMHSSVHHNDDNNDGNDCA